ncbi:MAG: hypothetical protein WDZ30_03440 [Cellvibrionaceae bacterium]
MASPLLNNQGTWAKILSSHKRLIETHHPAILTIELIAISGIAKTSLMEQFREPVEIRLALIKWIEAAFQHNGPTLGKHTPSSVQDTVLETLYIQLKQNFARHGIKGI